MSTLEAFHALGIALALGLLVGIERGWHARAVEEGRRMAGVRTFGITGLLGGVVGLLGESVGSPAVLAGAFVAFGILVAAGYWMLAHAEKAYGITTEVAALFTFAAGALTVAGHALPASAATVAVVVLLGTKAQMHGWVAALKQEEIHAATKLLLISVVVLPLLPREPLDPWGAFAPYEVWWMVVLVAGLSFAGYVAVRVAGPGRGLLVTAWLGGIVSSTVVSLTFSRMARKAPAFAGVLAAGVVAASLVMPLRVLVIVGVVNPGLVLRLAAPVAAMSVAGLVAVVVLHRRRAGEGLEQDVPLKNPLELGLAIRLGILLVAIRFLAEGVRRYAGSAGVYALSAASGIADVDPISLALARMARGELSPTVAANGIFLAVAVNTVVKAVLAVSIAGGLMGRRVAVALAVVLAAGTAGLAAGALLLR